jgi:hypothetical protein
MDIRTTGGLGIDKNDFNDFLREVHGEACKNKGVMISKDKQFGDITFCCSMNKPSGFFKPSNVTISLKKGDREISPITEEAFNKGKNRIYEKLMEACRQKINTI